MSEQIEVIVTIQVERFGGQLVRARPIGPWNVQAVAGSWKAARKKIGDRLQKVLPRSVPSNFYAGGLPEEHDHWTTHVSLQPAHHGDDWLEPVDIAMDSFRWTLNSGHCVVRVPAVNCMLFGKPEELDDDEVVRQARIALIRVAENLNLVELRQRFADREYDFKSMVVSVPISLEQDQQESKKSFKKQTAPLRAAGSDLTTAKLKNVYGMDGLAKDLADHFIGENPQSVLLVGPAGVGKTSCVHRMVQLRDELGLQDRRVWTTSGARIVSGMSGLGMWQERCTKLIRSAHQTNAIVHLGSLFELMEAGKIDGQPGVASMVRQAIRRRRLLAITECTPEQLAMIEREDPMLLRSFVKMELKEPLPEQLTLILKKAAIDIHGAGAFSDQAIEELYRLHSRFATYSAMPATALRLMNTMHEQPPSKPKAKRKKRKEAEPSSILPSTTRTKEFGADDVARAFAAQTGLPRFLVDDSIKLDLDRIRDQLSANVVGQNEPVDLIVNLIATLKARLVRPGRPLASLLFIGPTGVGKTEMAKAIARMLYSDARRMIRIDMSEYSAPWSSAKLIGKPGEGDGTLTSPIREQPFSVVLLDEFEKADPNVFDVLLQLLGEGRLTDSQGRLADFRNAVVIMTSNLGAESFREAAFGFGDSESAGWREHFEREVRKFVRPEFLGRIDRIVPFQPLPPEIVRKIARRELELLKQRAGFKYGKSSLEFDDAAIELISQIGYQPKYGARPLRRAIEENITVPLANALSQIQPESTWTFSLGAREGKITIDSQEHATKSSSLKEAEAELINSWQQLGAMARTARRSSPLRNLENELERNLRQNELLLKKIKLANGPRRLAKLKEQLAEGEAAVESARRLRVRLDDVIGRIASSQLDLMLRWHRNLSIDWDEFKAIGRNLLSQLRQITEDVVHGRISDSSLVTLMITGAGRAQLETLWNAYRILAEENAWVSDPYLVKPYDPLLDPDSTEHRKRVSEKKTDRQLPVEAQPVLRLLSASENSRGEKEKVCDLFRVADETEFVSLFDTVAGFALQIRGEGVGSWLDDEHGMVHFFDSRESGAKRRNRFKVSVFEGRLLSIELPSNWLDPIVAPERDPRRIVHIATQEIVDAFGKNTSYAQGKLSSALAQLIKDGHEQALWRAIGYQGIPREAQLLKELDVPF